MRLDEHLRQGPAIFINLESIAIDNANIGGGIFQNLDLPGNPVRHEYVIGRDETDVLATGQGHGLIDAFANATIDVVLEESACKIVPADPGMDDFNGIVSRAIIPNDQLNPRIGLLAHAFQVLHYEAGLIVAADQDRY